MTYKEAMHEAARGYLYRVLSNTGGQMKKAAAVAGVHRATFYKLLVKHGIQVEHRKYVRQTAVGETVGVLPRS